MTDLKVFSPCIYYLYLMASIFYVYSSYLLIIITPAYLSLVGFTLDRYILVRHCASEGLGPISSGTVHLYVKCPPGGIVSSFLEWAVVPSSYNAPSFDLLYSTPIG